MLLPALPFLAAVLMPAPVTGDFDRDGRPDRATVERSAAGQATLVVTHAGGGRSQLGRVDIEQPDFFVRLASPGEVAVACDISRLPPPACAEDQLAGGDTLAFGTGTSETVALWTGRQFALVAITDQ